MPVRVSSHYDYTVHLPEGTVRLQLARLTPIQYEAFNAEWQARKNGRGRPSFADPDSDDARAAELAYQQDHAAWALGVFDAYVSLRPGEYERVAADGDVEVVTSGRRFVELHAAEWPDLLAELWLQNSLTAEQKKSWQSQRASGTGSSTAPSPADPGPRPEPTATPAEPAASANPGGVMEPSSARSSGTTAPSSLEPALSEP